MRTVGSFRVFGERGSQFLGKNAKQMSKVVVHLSMFLLDYWFHHNWSLRTYLLELTWIQLFVSSPPRYMRQQLLPKQWACSIGMFMRLGWWVFLGRDILVDGHIILQNTPVGCGPSGLGFLFLSKGRIFDSHPGQHPGHILVSHVWMIFLVVLTS